MSSVSASPGLPGGTKDGVRGQDTRLWVGLGVAGPAVALAATLYAHLTPSAGLSPMTGLISDYALNSQAHGAILTATLALAAGCLWSVYGLTRAAPGPSAATRLLLACSAFGLMLTAIFPTDPTPGVTSMGGEIHRWSAAVVFTGLPCAAWMLARVQPPLPRWRLLRAGAVTSVLLLAAFLSAHPGSLVTGLIHGDYYYGLLQRFLLLSDTILVMLIAFAIPHVHKRGQQG